MSLENTSSNTSHISRYPSLNIEWIEVAAQTLDRPAFQEAMNYFLKRDETHHFASRYAKPPPNMADLFLMSWSQDFFKAVAGVLKTTTYKANPLKASPLGKLFKEDLLLTAQALLEWGATPKVPPSFSACVFARLMYENPAELDSLWNDLGVQEKIKLGLHNIKNHIEGHKWIERLKQTAYKNNHFALVELLGGPKREIGIELAQLALCFTKHTNLEDTKLVFEQLESLTPEGLMGKSALTDQMKALRNPLSWHSSDEVIEFGLEKIKEGKLGSVFEQRGAQDYLILGCQLIHQNNQKAFTALLDLMVSRNISVNASMGKRHHLQEKQQHYQYFNLMQHITPKAGSAKAKSLMEAALWLGSTWARDALFEHGGKITRVIPTSISELEKVGQFNGWGVVKSQRKEAIEMIKAHYEQWKLEASIAKPTQGSAPPKVRI